MIRRIGLEIIEGVIPAMPIIRADAVTWNTEYSTAIP